MKNTKLLITAMIPLTIAACSGAEPEIGLDKAREIVSCIVENNAEIKSVKYIIEGYEKVFDDPVYISQEIIVNNDGSLFYRNKTTTKTTDEDHVSESEFYLVKDSVYEEILCDKTYNEDTGNFDVSVFKMKDNPSYGQSKAAFTNKIRFITSFGNPLSSLSLHVEEAANGLSTYLYYPSFEKLDRTFIANYYSKNDLNLSIIGTEKFDLISYDGEKIQYDLESVFTYDNGLFASFEQNYTASNNDKVNAKINATYADSFPILLPSI